MAITTTILDSYRTIKVMGPESVLDVQYCTCQSIPHGLGFAYAVPRDTYLAGDALGLLDVISSQLEEIYSNGEMVASSPLQDLDANGLLQDWVAAVVSLDRTGQGLPPLTSTVNIPVDAFFAQETGIGGFTIPGSEAPNKYVADEYALLEQLNGG